MPRKSVAGSSPWKPRRCQCGPVGAGSGSPVVARQYCSSSVRWSAFAASNGRRDSVSIRLTCTVSCWRQWPYSRSCDERQASSRWSTPSDGPACAPACGSADDARYSVVAGSSRRHTALQCSSSTGINSRSRSMCAERWRKSDDDGPACGTLRPVAMVRSSRNKNHSRYNRREKMMGTNSWKSSGPFIGPKVKPRGSQVPEAVNTAIFREVSSSLSTWLKPSLRSPTEMKIEPATQDLI